MGTHMPLGYVLWKADSRRVEYNRKWEGSKLLQQGKVGREKSNQKAVGNSCPNNAALQCLAKKMEERDTDL